MICPMSSHICKLQNDDMKETVQKEFSRTSLSAKASEWVYVLHLADNSLILGQRNAEWCGHGPVLEQDIAITNISLDLIGQARNFYQHAASIYNEFTDGEKEEVEKWLPRLWKNYKRELREDDLAFLRDENQYINLLITELPKGDWAYTVLRQFFFSAFQFEQFTSLLESRQNVMASIAEKSLKEINYHLRWSAEWVIRLGDGTDESRQRTLNALSELWMFTGECFLPGSFEKALSLSDINRAKFKEEWMGQVKKIFFEAGISVPTETNWFQTGGKEGKHTEHLGYLLTEMQYLQKTFPNANW
jgi:ring-1,2-phenylacetyl-CoA epoxidase subunit PaaC